MNSGFQSRFIADALTQRQIFVERAKTALHDEHDAVSSAVIAALIVGLGRVAHPRMGQLSRVELNALVRRVLKAYDKESSNYVGRLTHWLELYSDQEARYMTGVMNQALDAPDQEAPVAWPYVTAGIIGATGLGVKQTFTGLRTTQRNAIRKVLQRAYVQNWTVGQVTTAFRGTVSLNLKDGLLPKLKRAASATVDTVVQFGMSSARFKAMQGFLDYTLGYTWVSILDGHTSSICRSLSGQVFKYGAGPIPPMHYRCRSHIMPIFRKTAKLHKMASGAVGAFENYYTWLKRQPFTVQKDVLGPTWSKLFRDGGLSPDEFAAKVVNRRYEPLSLDELRNKSPDAFARAGI